MEIIHQLDDLFYSLFPDLTKGDTKSIKQAMARYYSTPFFQPDVSVENDRVIIHIYTDQLESLEMDYKRAIALCDSGKFNDAKILLASLIEKNPTNSDFYRILGQIHSEEGDQDAAINHLIEALKWNNQNTYALTMMGNILFLHKEDPDTALIYFNQVLKINPNDHLALNNIGSQLGKLGRMDEARSYLERALESNPEFSNTYLGLGIIADNSGNHKEAFDYYLAGLRHNSKKDDLFQKTIGNLVELCNRIVENDFGNSIIDRSKSDLESRSGVPILIEESSDVPYYAKIE
ncbi:MAG: tetratricopeptide repeat protein [Leptospiraceae bacterium]|nr:tetratricopeptide repeat protein [Leptospiraceae bacterium]